MVHIGTMVYVYVLVPLEYHWYRRVPIDYNSDQIPCLISLRYVRILFYQVALKNTNTNQNNLAKKDEMTPSLTEL